MRLRHVLRWVVVGWLGLSVVSATVGWLMLRGSLPTLDGEVEIATLRAPVEIARDAHGIPHIRAESMHDAYVALGYAHAQDRLFQMEAMRRSAAGRLAEVVGSSAVGIDRRMRTFGIYRLAESDAEALPPDVREAYEAYASGVNAFLAERPRLPPELLALGVRPERWRVADSLAWQRLMALQLTGNWGSELFRQRLAERLDPEDFRALYPRDLPGEPVTIASSGIAPEQLDEALRFAAVVDPDGGSNAWAVTADRTANGAPLLANDPHLGLSAPGTWYLARIDTPELTLAGATAPGVPHLVLGHNGRLAWGMTTPHSDTADVFLERVDPDDPDRYLTPNGSEPFESRRETIPVRWGDDVPIEIRSTRHGPLIAEPSGPDATGAALAHAGLLPHDTSAVALFRSNRAGSWAELRETLRWVGAPHQNVMAADSEGTIALLSVGRIPIRRDGDGFLPSQGWTEAGKWVGFVPFDELPEVVSPTGGTIVNANNRLVDDDYAHWLGADWAPPFRAARIEEMLAANGTHTADDFAAMQLDHVSLAARELLDILLSPELRPAAPSDVLAALDAWDGAKALDRPEPLIFAAWMRALDRTLVGRRLGPHYGDWRGAEPRVIRGILTEHAQRWCDPPRSRGAHPCAAAVADTLHRAIDQLRAEKGDDWREWRWGEAHTARFRHIVLGWLPVLRNLVDPRIPNHGGNDTVNRGGMRLGSDRDPFMQVHGPGLRAVYDLADLDSSRFMIAPGQSGNPLSRHFDDLVAPWRDGEFVALAPLEEPAHRLRLVPGRR